MTTDSIQSKQGPVVKENKRLPPRKQSRHESLNLYGFSGLSRTAQ